MNYELTEHQFVSLWEVEQAWADRMHPEDYLIAYFTLELVEKYWRDREKGRVKEELPYAS